MSKSTSFNDDTIRNLAASLMSKLSLCLPWNVRGCKLASVLFLPKRQAIAEFGIGEAMRVFRFEHSVPRRPGQLRASTEQSRWVGKRRSTPAPDIPVRKLSRRIPMRIAFQIQSSRLPWQSTLLYPAMAMSVLGTHISRIELAFSSLVQTVW
ncbi:hypothetical protein ARMGADRAFT_158238 [Armillaria gallica]|uniref:Uncharacterized protein n=1 Tax=Armillaria gallica TaxID=47427 RepID=A0A2H3CVH4_ARMGA|nr:hypothetical protein ARMGADRAFT_158238 [Armillaria gallica]